MTGGGPLAEETAAQLRSVLDAAGLGIFDYDSSTGESYSWMVASPAKHGPTSTS